MPLIHSSYHPAFPFTNTHINTIHKTLFFREQVNYTRKRIDTPDADFLDLDFSTVGSDTLVVAMHGLEGSSNSKYIISATKHLNAKGLDVVAVNFRGCSGEDNKHIYSYNSGKTDDLHTILKFLSSEYDYNSIVLLGYSMGGNITMKYLGEQPLQFPQVKCAIGVSVPCDLEGSSAALQLPVNKVYILRFLNTLIKKGVEKCQKYPNSILDESAIRASKNFVDLDNSLTAPLFGFKDAFDYWRKSSSRQFLKDIEIPSLILSAQDDTFLSESCYPFEIAKNHKFLHLETPKYGGHVGFNNPIWSSSKHWSEHRISDFINSWT